MTDFKEENVVLRNRVVILEMAIAMWDATFSKYPSWKANDVDLWQYRDQIIKDYNKCSSATKHLWGAPVTPANPKPAAKTDRRNRRWLQ